MRYSGFPLLFGLRTDGPGPMVRGVLHGSGPNSVTSVHPLEYGLRRSTILKNWTCDRMRAQLNARGEKYRVHVLAFYHFIFLFTSPFPPLFLSLPPSSSPYSLFIFLFHQTFSYPQSPQLTLHLLLPASSLPSFSLLSLYLIFFFHISSLPSEFDIIYLAYYVLFNFVERCRALYLHL